MMSRRSIKKLKRKKTRESLKQKNKPKLSKDKLKNLPFSKAYCKKKTKTIPRKVPTNLKPIKIQKLFSKIHRNHNSTKNKKLKVKLKNLRKMKVKVNQRKRKRKRKTNTKN